MNQVLKKENNELLVKKKKGFTLIELIIVIAIIAILAAIAMPKFGAIKERSNKSSDIANAKNISMAVSKAIAEDKVIIPAGGVVRAALGSVGGADIQEQLDGIDATTKLKTNTHKTETFTVSIDAAGKITVYAGNDAAAKQIYPVADDDFTK